MKQYKMSNFDYITKEDIKENNLNLPQISKLYGKDPYAKIPIAN